MPKYSDERQARLAERDNLILDRFKVMVLEQRFSHKSAHDAVLAELGPFVAKSTVYSATKAWRDANPEERVVRTKDDTQLVLLRIAKELGWPSESWGELVKWAATNGAGTST